MAAADPGQALATHAAAGPCMAAVFGQMQAISPALEQPSVAATLSMQVLFLEAR
jgi:hypothetical protein